MRKIITKYILTFTFVLFFKINFINANDIEAEKLFLSAQNKLAVADCDSNKILVNMYDEVFQKIYSNDLLISTENINQIKKIIFCLDFYQDNIFDDYQNIFLNFNKTNIAFELYTSENYFDQDEINLSLDVLYSFLGFKNKYEAMEKLKSINSNLIELIYTNSSILNDQSKKQESFIKSANELKKLRSKIKPEASNFLNFSEVYMLESKLINCEKSLNLATKDSIKDIMIEIEINLNLDGSLNFYKISNDLKYENQKNFEIAQRQIDSIFNNEQCQKFEFPQKKYKNWKKLIIKRYF